MIYREERRDLFGTDKNYALVHCISSDFAMGAGIAVAFTRMGVKAQLERLYQKNFWEGDGYCLFTAPVQIIYNQPVKRITFNLVTKQRCFHKPTYDTLKQALLDLKKQCMENQIKRLAMPKIGCGLDRLAWDKVSAMIQEIFADTDFEILVCYR